MGTLYYKDMTNAECGYIAITAMEGGIGYWSAADSYDYRRWSDSDGSPIEVDDDFVFYHVWEHGLDGDYQRHGDDRDLPDFSVPDDGKFAITPALIRRGLDLLLQSNTYVAREILSLPREDWASIDATGADCIIQYAIFGEIVYG
jgi:hypothetical protein